MGRTPLQASSGCPQHVPLFALYPPPSGLCPGTQAPVHSKPLPRAQWQETGAEGRGRGQGAYPSHSLHRGLLQVSPTPGRPSAHSSCALPSRVLSLLPAVSLPGPGLVTAPSTLGDCTLSLSFPEILLPPLQVVPLLNPLKPPIANHAIGFPRGPCRGANE